MFGPEWAVGLIVCDWHGETMHAETSSIRRPALRI